MSLHEARGQRISGTWASQQATGTAVCSMPPLRAGRHAESPAVAAPPEAIVSRRLTRVLLDVVQTSSVDRGQRGAAMPTTRQPRSGSSACSFACASASMGRRPRASPPSLVRGCISGDPHAFTYLSNGGAPSSPSEWHRTACRCAVPGETAAFVWRDAGLGAIAEPRVVCPSEARGSSDVLRCGTSTDSGDERAHRTSCSQWQA